MKTKSFAVLWAALLLVVGIGSYTWADQSRSRSSGGAGFTGSGGACADAAPGTKGCIVGSGDQSIGVNLDVKGDAGVAMLMARGIQSGPVPVSSDAGFIYTGPTGTFAVQSPTANGGLVVNTNTIALQSAGSSAWACSGTACTMGISRHISFSDFTDDSANCGNRTVNKARGMSCIANLAASVTITNSLVTTTSQVIAQLCENDAATSIGSVVPAAGSFTVNLTAGTTADRTICWLVVN